MFLIWEWGLRASSTPQPVRRRGFAAQMGSPGCVNNIYAGGILFPIESFRISQMLKLADLTELQPPPSPGETKRPSDIWRLE